MASLVQRRPGETVAYLEGVSSAYRYCAAQEGMPEKLRSKLEAMLELNEAQLKHFKETHEAALALDAWNPNESEEH